MCAYDRPRQDCGREMQRERDEGGGEKRRRKYGKARKRVVTRFHRRSFCSRVSNRSPDSPITCFVIADKDRANTFLHRWPAASYLHSRNLVRTCTRTGTSRRTREVFPRGGTTVRFLPRFRLLSHSTVKKRTSRRSPRGIRIAARIFIAESSFPTAFHATITQARLVGEIFH